MPAIPHIIAKFSNLRKSKLSQAFYHAPVPTCPRASSGAVGSGTRILRLISRAGRRCHFFKLTHCSRASHNAPVPSRTNAILRSNCRRYVFVLIPRVELKEVMVSHLFRVRIRRHHFDARVSRARLVVFEPSFVSHGSEPTGITSIFAPSLRNLVTATCGPGITTPFDQSGLFFGK